MAVPDVSRAGPDGPAPHVVTETPADGRGRGGNAPAGRAAVARPFRATVIDSPGHGPAPSSATRRGHSASNNKAFPIAGRAERKACPMLRNHHRPEPTLPRRRILLGIAGISAASLAARPAIASVWNGPELRHALAHLPAGSRIRLMPGAYGDTGGFLVGAEGLTLEGEEGAELAEGMVALASGLVISGQHFTNGLTVNGPGTLVTGCDFAGHALHIDAHATGAEVTNCTFHDAAAGVSILSVGSGQATANINAAAYIHDNKFSNLAAGYQESLYIKSSGNRVINNSLTNCNNITSRNGSNNVIQGNTSTGGYGIVIQDNDNHVTGNQVISPKKGKGIFIMAGTMSYDSNIQGGHAQAYNTKVTGNSGPLMLGKQYGADYTYPALNTQVSSHTGTITHMNDQGTTIT